MGTRPASAKVLGPGYSRGIIVAKLTHTSVRPINADAMRRGKANQALMMSLTSEDHDWLAGVNRTQYCFEYQGLSIYRRNALMPNVKISSIGMENLQKQYQTVRSLNSNQFLNSTTEYQQQGEMLCNELLLASSKLIHELIRETCPQMRYIGDIYDANDEQKTDLDLVDIYMYIRNISDDREALEHIYREYSIPEPTFEPLFIDDRTHWGMAKCPSASFSESRTNHEIIKFENHNQVVGEIEVDPEHGLTPHTEWCKGKNQYGRGHTLMIPFERPYPLFGLPNIQTHHNRIVLLTDNLFAAYSVQKELDTPIESLLKARNDYNQLLNMIKMSTVDEEFEKELKKCILDLNDNSGDNHSALQNINFCGVPHDFKLVCYDCARIIIAGRGLDVELNRSTDNSILDVCCNILRDHEMLQCTAIDSLLGKQIHNMTRTIGDFFCPKHDFNHWKFIKPVSDPISQQVKDYCRLISSILTQKKIEAETKIATLRKEWEDQIEYCCTSWFGGDEAIADVNWWELRNREVYFIFDDSEKSLVTAVRLVNAASCIKNLKFINAQGKEFSKEELIKFAKSHGITSQPLDSQGKINRGMQFDEFDPKKQIAPVNFLLDGLITERSTSMLYAPSGIGKTWFAMCMAQAMAHGTRVFHNSDMWRAVRPRQVAYIDSEMNEQNFHKRLQLLESAYNAMMPAGQLQCPILYKQVSGMNLNLVSDESEGRDRVSQWIENSTSAGRPIDFLIIDNLSTVSAFNDSAKSWNNLFAWLKELNSRKHPIACLVVHHAGKSGDQRGSSAKVATVDNVIRLTKPDADEPINDNQIRLEVRLEKGRDIPDGIRRREFAVALKVSDENASFQIINENKSDKAVDEIIESYISGNKRLPLEIIAALTGRSLSHVKKVSVKCNEEGISVKKKKQSNK